MPACVSMGGEAGIVSLHEGWRVPGAAQHEAKRNGALQTRDRYGIARRKTRVNALLGGPGSAVHRFAHARAQRCADAPACAPRCTASGRQAKSSRTRVAAAVEEAVLVLL